MLLGSEVVLELDRAIYDARVVAVSVGEREVQPI